MQAQNRMESAPIGKLILAMSWPPLLSMFLQFSYNMIDSAFVAQLSENALAAVSLSFPITSLLNAASVWIAVGTNILIAGHLGRHDQDAANHCAAQGLVLSVMCGIILNIAALLIMRPYFHSFTDSPETYSLCLIYLGIYSFMQIPDMVHIMIQKIIQGTGNMVSPMWFQIAGVIINLVFDPLLIFGIGPFPALGIAGAAVASVGGCVLSMVLALAYLVCGTRQIHITLHGFHIDRGTIGQIFSLGLPSFILTSLGSFTVTFANLFLKLYSETTIAFFGAWFKVQQVIMMTVNGLIQGTMPVMRFNYTGGRLKRVRSAFRYGTLYSILMTGIGMAIVMLFPAPILNLFAASEEMQLFGIPAMRIMSAGLIFAGVTTMTATYFQAIEKVRESMLLQLLRQLVLLLPVMWLLNQVLQLTGIWLSFPVTELATFLIAQIMLLKETNTI